MFAVFDNQGLGKSRAFFGAFGSSTRKHLQDFNRLPIAQ
jgi:hypothetical protein